MSATPDSTFTTPEKLIADLQRQLAECRAERDEALQRETATAEVLQVINSSPGNLAPVFDAMLDKATRLCDAAFGVLWGVDGDRFVAIASHNVPAGFADFTRQPIGRDEGAALTDVARGAAFVHVADLGNV